MKDLNHYVDIYQQQLKKGEIQEAYVGLIKYVTRLGTTLSRNLSYSYSFGNLHFLFIKGGGFWSIDKTFTKNGV